MNNNKYNLKIGQLIHRDKEFNNKFTVVIIGFTPKGLYTTIRNFGEKEKWQIMTNRLIPLNN